MSCATYYFNSDANTEGQADVSKAFRLAYLNHLGSIAMGAFIIALVQLAKIIFVYAAKAAANPPIIHEKATGRPKPPR